MKTKRVDRFSAFAFLFAPVFVIVACMGALIAFTRHRPGDALAFYDAYGFGLDDVVAALMFLLASYLGGLVARMCARGAETTEVEVQVPDLAAMRDELGQLRGILDDMHDLMMEASTTRMRASTSDR